jgi:hypothetical protein
VYKLGFTGTLHTAIFCVIGERWQKPRNKHTQTIRGGARLSPLYYCHAKATGHGHREHLSSKRVAREGTLQHTDTRGSLQEFQKGT